VTAHPARREGLCVDPSLVDCGALYQQGRRQLMEVTLAQAEDQLARAVPATPAWSVHDVLSHLVGITADLNAQCFGSDDPEAWTDRQIASRRDRTTSELDGEWAHEAPRFEEGLRLLGYEIGSHYIGDLLQHSYDIQSALGLHVPADDQTFDVALDFYLEECDRRLATAGVGSVVVRTPSRDRTLGLGAVMATLDVDRFELFRSLGGRRSEAQVRSMSWTGDVDRVLRCWSAYPMPSLDLEDGCGAQAGTGLRYRAMRSSDGPALERFHEALSPDAQRSRFFIFHPHLSASEIERFTHVDHVDREALVVTRGAEIVAVGRYDRLPDRSDAEVAFVTAEDHRGEGLASQLLARLADAARAVGISDFVAETFGDNSRMLGVFTRSGLPTSVSYRDGVANVSMSLELVTAAEGFTECT
jgi:GNAT superfamily N-acetyltransferase